MSGVGKREERGRGGRVKGGEERGGGLGARRGRVEVEAVGVGADMRRGGLWGEGRESEEGINKMALQWIISSLSSLV
jgi:hypothetical protein